MSLINYKDIDCKKSIDKNNKIINFNGTDIEIINYLSANDKYDLIMVTLQKAFEKNIYNSFKMDMYFDLNVVYSYTNIVFSIEDRADEAMLYDVLKSSGLIDKIKAEIDPCELEYLKDCIITMSQTIIKYRNTFGAIFGSFMELLPENLEKVKAVVKELDIEKIKALMAITGGSLNFN